MKLKLSRETLQVLIPEECSEIQGGTAGRGIGFPFRCQPLGASSDLCCGSGSCPRPAPEIRIAAPAPGKFTDRGPTKFTPDFTKQCAMPGQHQVKKG